MWWCHSGLGCSTKLPFNTQTVWVLFSCVYFWVFLWQSSGYIFKRIWKFHSGAGEGKAITSVFFSFSFNPCTEWELWLNFFSSFYFLCSENQILLQQWYSFANKYIGLANVCNLKENAFFMWPFKVKWKAAKDWLQLWFICFW